MANVHNALLRGLNAIYLQAAQVTEARDITDFMVYIKSWTDTVHHHHSLEETLFFPRLGELLKAVGEPEHLMDANVDQHHMFEPKMMEMHQYVQDVLDEKTPYDSGLLKGLIDGFAPVLTEHLHDEIDTLMRLEKCDGQEVRKIFTVVADTGAKTADPASDITAFVVFPAN